jgi:hypothetical protein
MEKARYLTSLSSVLLCQFYSVHSVSRRPRLSRSLLAQYLLKGFNSVLLRVIFNISNECLKLVIASFLHVHVTPQL